MLLKGLVVGVLGEPPGRIGAGLAGERVAGPAMDGNDQFERCGASVLGPYEVGDRVIVVAEVRSSPRCSVLSLEVEQCAGDFWMGRRRWIAC
ncbi:hypothetical protein [Streptomyces sp. NPDC004296]|uniref:hypothetical protein n=1 Tax=Streptomyces sp. NPDC004296 TaxID=3364697 RepID=UPI0036AB650F